MNANDNCPIGIVKSYISFLNVEFQSAPSVSQLHEDEFGVEHWREKGQEMNVFAFTSTSRI